MTPLDTAAAVLAVLLYLAAVALVGVPMAREWLYGRLGGPLQARDGAAAPSAPSEGQGGPLAGVSGECPLCVNGRCSYQNGCTGEMPVAWRTDAALYGLARHEAADWTGWRPSYDGEDVDPGEPWQPKQRGETE